MYGRIAKITAYKTEPNSRKFEDRTDRPIRAARGSLDCLSLSAFWVMRSLSPTTSSTIRSSPLAPSSYFLLLMR